MAKSKLLLVEASGQLSDLDMFIETCRKSGDIYPESASRHIYSSMGFTCLSEDNPYTAKKQKIEELAALSGFSITPPEGSGDFKYDDNFSIFIDKIENELKLYFSDKELLENQLERCEEGIFQFSHYEELDIPIEDTTSCYFISVRYGHLPKEQVIKLKAYENNPYMLFIPCSSDTSEIWGVYFAPKEKIREIDRIFALMFFDRIYVPGAVGTPTEIVKVLRENVCMLKQQLNLNEKKLAAFWERNGKRFCELYYGLKWLSECFELRQYCVVLKDRFCYICWIPKSNLTSFKKCMDVLEYTTYDISEKDKTNYITPPDKQKHT